MAKDLPPLPGTKVTSAFIEARKDSWQVHLQQISPFLVAGVGVWWSYTPDGFLFHDGDTDPANPGDAFSLMKTGGKLAGIKLWMRRQSFLHTVSSYIILMETRLEDCYTVRTL